MDLPAEVRAQVLQLAAEHLGSLKPELVPGNLQRVYRFTPAKRARLGAAALLRALDDDPGFRQGVAARATDAETDVERAAAAYLQRSTGWEELVAQVAEQLEARTAAAQEKGRLDAVQRLTEQLAQTRAAGREEIAQLRAQLAEAQADAQALRRKVREMGDRAGRAEAAQRQAEADRDAALEALTPYEQQLAALQQALKERAAQPAPQSTRRDDELRLRLLLDTLLGAAQGLRRELALPPAEGRPADALASDYAPAPRNTGTEPDLASLLVLPHAHLLVDGYNVTKTAYPQLTLEQQRTRLTTGLSALAARTSVEVTVVFDGADGHARTAAPRGVRVLFSRTGETADEVLRRLAAHEPQGRPVVVVSSDREVAEGVRRSGARAVASAELVRLLAH
ncbi:MAG: NYN domain-containing protein [Mycobacteriales bacterium]